MATNPTSNKIQIYPDEIKYAYFSCLIGNYEKSCQYLLNLCVLAMYDKSNIFCGQILNDINSNFTSKLGIKNL